MSVYPAFDSINLCIDKWTPYLPLSHYTRIILQDITVSPKIHEEILRLENERDIVIRTGGKSGQTQEEVVIVRWSS